MKNMDLSFHVLCLCFLLWQRGVFGVETELYGDSIDNPEFDKTTNNTEVEYSGDNTKTELIEDINKAKNGSDDARLDIDKRPLIKTMKVMEGDTVTLGSGSLMNEDDHIIWTYKSQQPDIYIGVRNKSVDYGNSVERFGDRLQVDKQTGSLTIRNIRTTDSGLYYQITVIQDLTARVDAPTIKFNLSVLAPLPVPVFTRISNSSKCSSISLASVYSSKCVLLCSVLNVTDVSLSWYKGNSLLSSISVSDLNIRLSLPLEVKYQDNNTYRCVVNNTITNQTQHLNINDVCPGCPESILSYVLGFLVFLLSIIFGICFCCCYAKWRGPILIIR
ncbi:uncharacterized protein [Misgurnus anguillicaudatus]|uniref:uncharacterized protein n=1 Tax=Misgurnus anguillicaudatus TaxID=75329 RepID=UPI003CCF607F